MAGGFLRSCLLMPRKLVFAAWDEMFPDRKQRVLRPATPVKHPFVEIPRIVRPDRRSRFLGERRRDAGPVLPGACRMFLVSPIAMRIRLEKLGLLLREVPHQRILAGGLCAPFLRKS